MLLAALLCILAISPFVTASVAMRWVLFGATLGMSVFALLACGIRRRGFFVIALFGGASVVVSGVDRAIGGMPWQVVADGLRFTFLALVTGAILSDVLRSRHVTTNTIFGAASTYLLTALAWAALFAVLESLQKGSFSVEYGPGSGRGAWDVVDGQLTYFSLVTMTTIGYGDIRPLTPPARVLSALEGLIGQLFVAIVIARLVALEISDRIGARTR